MFCPLVGVSSSPYWSSSCWLADWLVRKLEVGRSEVSTECRIWRSPSTAPSHLPNGSTTLRDAPDMQMFAGWPWRVRMLASIGGPQKNLGHCKLRLRVVRIVGIQTSWHRSGLTQCVLGLSTTSGP